MIFEEIADMGNQDQVQTFAARMPGIACPHPFDVATIQQLLKDCTSEIVSPPHHWTPMCWCLAKRSDQANALARQVHMWFQRRIIRLPQGIARGPNGQLRNLPVIGFINWSQLYVCNDSKYILITFAALSEPDKQILCRKHYMNVLRPIESQMQAGLLRFLLAFVISAFCPHAAKANLAQDLLLRKGQAIEDCHQEIVAEQFFMHQVPESLFESPQISGLTYKGDAIYTLQCREEVTIVETKHLKELPILRPTQRTSHDFHYDHLAIDQGRCSTSERKQLPYNTVSSTSLIRQKTWIVRLSTFIGPSLSLDWCVSDKEYNFILQGNFVYCVTLSSKEMI